MKDVLPSGPIPASVAVFMGYCISGIPMGASFYCETIINNPKWFSKEDVEHAEKIQAIPPISSSDLPDFMKGR